MEWWWRREESGMEREWRVRVRTIRAREMIMCGCAAFVWGAVCDAESTRREQAGGRLDLRREKRSQNDRSCYTAPLRSPVPTRRTTTTHASRKKPQHAFSPQSHTLVFYSSMARGPLRCSLCAPRHCTQPPSLSPTPHRCPPPPPSTTSQMARPPHVPPCPTSACCPYRTI